MNAEDALAVVQTFLAADIVERNRVFANQMRQLKLRLLKENMWSSSVAVNHMQDLAVAEFKVRESLILETWQRVLSSLDPVARNSLLSQASRNIARTLDAERGYLERVVTSQPVGGLPNPNGFLEEVSGLATSRAQAELDLLEAEAKQGQSTINYKATDASNLTHHPLQSAHVNPISRDYDVCLSFAGEDRPYVEQVARMLNERGVRVFYDGYEQADLWGKDLYQHLGEVYRNRARFCVIFASEAYSKKVWTRHELANAQARALRENTEYVLPARFDNTEIPGLNPDVGYLDLGSLTPRDLAGFIIEKLAHGPPSPEFTNNSRDRAESSASDPVTRGKPLVSRIISQPRRFAMPLGVLVILDRSSFSKSSKFKANHCGAEV